MDPDAIIHICLDLIKNTPMDGKVGIEMGSVTHHFYTALTEALPEGWWWMAPPSPETAEWSKCQWEIDMLRLAAQEADKAWRAMIEEVKPGMPAWKLDAMFSYYASKLNLEHGTALKRTQLHPAAGPYYGLCGMPRGYILQAGDIIKFDVGYQYLGYWSDIARTFAVGGTAPDEALSSMTPSIAPIAWVSVCQARWWPCGTSTVPSGKRWRRAAWFPKYPRGHMGHSIGCGVGPEEYPTIAPGTDYVLEPNMVVCLETPTPARAAHPYTAASIWRTPI